MLDHTIAKPLSIEAYALHRMVAELCSGSTYQFVDRGDHFVVRTTKDISANGKSIPQPKEGEVLAFSLRASVAGRRKNTNIYPASGDWRYRRAWLEQHGEKAGFEIMAVHVTSRHMKVQDKSGRKFSIDCTDFTGVLKVTNESLFTEVMHKGIGRVGKAFGMGMLII